MASPSRPQSYRRRERSARLIRLTPQRRLIPKPALPQRRGAAVLARYQAVKAFAWLKFDGSRAEPKGVKQRIFSCRLFSQYSVRCAILFAFGSGQFDSGRLEFN